MFKEILLKTIRFYQRTLSVDHGFFSFFYKMRFLGCRFEPTCSEYAYQAIEKYGAAKGGFWALKRVLKCHPFNKGGYDPIK